MDGTDQPGSPFNSLWPEQLLYLFLFLQTEYLKLLKMKGFIPFFYILGWFIY